MVNGGRVRIAVVVHDTELRERTLLPLLRDAGFEAVGLPSALALYRELVRSYFQLILLGIDLPDEDGQDVALHLRDAAPLTRVVMLARNQAGKHPLRNADAGSAGPLTLPIDPTSLLAAVGAAIRYRKGSGGDAAGWHLDLHGWRIHSPSGRAIALTLAERHVLRLLVANQGAPVKRSDLILALVGDVDGFDPHRLDMVIHRLRRKCMDACGEALPLKSVRGIGYVLI